MTPESLVRLVCVDTGVPYGRLMSRGMRKPDRRVKTAAARTIAACALRMRFGFSYPLLAPLIGCRHHTTAMYHVSRGLQTPALLAQAERYAQLDQAVAA